VDLGLCFQAHVAHFVQVERTSVGAFQGAALLRRTARLRAVPIAEQLSLNVSLGDGRAVQLHKNTIPPQALGMNGAGNQFLARARLAVDEHPAVGGSHQPNLLPQRLHRNACAGEHRAHAELTLEFEVFRPQPPCLHCVLEHDQRAIQRKRLLQKVVRTELGGLHRGLNGAVAADDHHLRPHLHRQLVHIGQHIQSIPIGKPDVEQDHVIGRVLNQHHRFAGGGGAGHAIALFAQNLFQRSANLRLVVHHQNVIHDCSPLSGATPLPGVRA